MWEAVERPRRSLSWSWTLYRLGTISWLGRLAFLLASWALNDLNSFCKVWTWVAWAWSTSLLLALRSLLYSILRVSSLCQEKVASCRIFSKLLTRYYNSRTRKNSPTWLAKASASMVGGLFAIATMNCWGKKFTKVGIRSGLFCTVPWCAMAACNASWEVVTMAMA